MESKTKARIAQGGIVAAMLIAVPFIIDREGESLESYRDVAGVWTICHGETLGVGPGQKATKEECAALTNSRVGQFMGQVRDLIKVDVSPKTLAAHTSFSFNIGVAGIDPITGKCLGYKCSQALALTNKGDLAAGCRAMANWYSAGGKDCRVRANRCYGLINRRNEEIALCLAGLE